MPASARVEKHQVVEQNRLGLGRDEGRPPRWVVLWDKARGQLEDGNG